MTAALPAAIALAEYELLRKYGRKPVGAPAPTVDLNDAIRPVNAELHRSTVTRDWPRLRYLIALLDRADNWQAADAVVDAICDVGARLGVAAECSNLNGMLLSRRGRYDDALHAFEDAYLTASIASSGLAPTIASNMAIVAGRAGRIEDGATWLRRAQQLPASEVPNRDDLVTKLALLTGRFDLDHEAMRVDDLREDLLALTATAQAVFRLPQRRTEDLVALAGLCRRVFDTAKVGRDLAWMRQASEVLDAVVTLMSATLGQLDHRSAAAEASAATFCVDIAVASNSGSQLKPAMARIDAAHKRMAEVFGPSHPETLMISMDCAVAEIEHARIIRSLEAMRVGVARLSTVTNILTDVVGPEDPRTIMAIGNLGCAQLDLECQEAAPIAVRDAYGLLESAISQTRSRLGERHPAVTVLESQLDICRSLAADGNDQLLGTTAVATLPRTARGEWNTRYRSFVEAAGFDVATPAGAAPTGAPRSTIDIWSIVERAQAGDSDSLGAIYDRYFDAVFRFVYFRVGNHTLAEDLTSDTFLQAFKRIGSFTWQGRDLGAWLVTIARNLIADHFKSGRYRLEVTIGDVLDVDREYAMDSANPETCVVDHVTNVQLLNAVKQLSPEQQELIVRRYLQGFTVAETAQAMNKTEGATKALQYRAVRALVRLLPEDFQP